VDVCDNDIPADKLQEIDQSVRSNRLRLIRDDSSKSLSEIDLSSRYLDAKDAIVVAEYIKDNGALSVLSLQSNKLNADCGKALAKGLKGNQVITELNLADNNLANSGYNMTGVIALADAIPDMGALLKLDISRNGIGRWNDGGLQADLQRICVASGIELAK
jgi:hypothetical protein